MNIGVSPPRSAPCPAHSLVPSATQGCAKSVHFSHCLMFPCIFFHCAMSPCIFFTVQCLCAFFPLFNVAMHFFSLCSVSVHFSHFSMRRGTEDGAQKGFQTKGKGHPLCCPAALVKSVLLTAHSIRSKRGCPEKRSDQIQHAMSVPRCSE